MHRNTDPNTPASLGTTSWFIVSTSKQRIQARSTFLESSCFLRQRVSCPLNPDLAVALFVQLRLHSSQSLQVVLSKLEDGGGFGTGNARFMPYMLKKLSRSDEPTRCLG